jgi:hypothetical protein
MKAKALATAAAVILSSAATLTVLTGTAEASGAANCSWKPHNNSNIYGYFHSNGYNYYNLYKGPASTCDKTGVALKKTVDFTIRCKTTNNPASTLWFYITDLDSGATGWTSASNAFPSGNVTNC